ncbi:MAG: RNA pseudouridine synthase [Saprospiraceae bacterium]|nr:RNA pseudouridine synthase [Saprospiraceae bacterium]
MDSLSQWIIYSDHHYLLVNKPAGIPVQDDQTGDKSLIRLMQAYCKHDLYLIHRIDRPVSGAVLFAKNKEAQAFLSNENEKKNFLKTYLALVPKTEIEEKGTWIDYLVHDKKKFKSSVVSDSTMKDAKKAILHYSIIRKLDNYNILEITTETGRFHQIRAQLSFRNIPIKGDVKYGARRGNKDRSIGLHAWKIEWMHHTLHKKMMFTIDPPESFIQMRITE